MKKILSVYLTYREKERRWEAYCPELEDSGFGDVKGDALTDLRYRASRLEPLMPEDMEREYYEDKLGLVRARLEAIGWRMPECEPPAASDMEASDGEFSHMEFDLPWLDAVAGECKELDGLLNNQKGGNTMETNETRTGTSEVKGRLGDILLAVSWLHVAHDYFHKPASWLYDRLDGREVFTGEERLRLKGALTDLARRIIACADCL